MCEKIALSAKEKYAKLGVTELCYPFYCVEMRIVFILSHTGALTIRVSG